MVKIIKLHKKRNGCYPADLEGLGLCDQCNSELGARGYLIDGANYMLCTKCYLERSDGHGHKRTSPASKTG